MRRVRLCFWILLTLAVLSGQPINSSTQAAPVPFPNGGFEVDANSDGKPDEWSWPDSDWVWDGSVAHSGTRSARIHRSGGATTAYLGSAKVFVEPSTTYTLTYWLRTQNASRHPSSAVCQYNNSDLQIGLCDFIYVSVGDGTNDWQRITYRFQTAPDASYVRLIFYLNTKTTGTFWFDDFALEEGPAALYPFQGGFPVETDGWNVRSSPTVADLDGDGNNELLVTDYGGKVYAWNASGALLPGYPLPTGGHIVGHLALGDLNHDGDLEIVAGVGSINPGAEGRVFVWQPDGTLLSGWPQNVARYGTDRLSGISTVVLADIDNDADLEVIAGTNNNNLASSDPSFYVPNLYVWHHTGNLADGKWPVEDDHNVAILSTIAVGDLNSDGDVDIITGRDYNRLFAYDNQGNDLPGWPVYTFVPEDGNWNDRQIEHDLSAPTLADLDQDGVVEYIAAGTRCDYAHSGVCYNNDLLVLQPDGTRRPGWETPAGGVGILSDDVWMPQSSAIGDLDGDNRFDIVVPTQDGWIRAYDADKTLLWQFEFAQGELIIYASEPVIGDIDDDGLNEVIFGTYDPLYGTTGPVGLWILENDGSVKAGSPLPVGTPGILSPPTLADLDGDGDLDIVATTSVGVTYVWDTPAPFDPTRLPWPTARHDIQRTAFFVPNLAPSIKTTSVSAADQGEMITYTIALVRTGPPLTSTVRVTDVIPTGLSYISGTLNATHGVPDDSLAPTLRWTGLLSDTALVEITYVVSVTESSAASIINSATINAGTAGQLTRSASVIVNGRKLYLPVVYRSFAE